MPKRKQYILSVTYSLRRHLWGSLDSKLDKLIGSQHTGSGTGFGERDLDWWFDSAKARDDAAVKVRRYYPKLEVRKSCYAG